MSNNQDIINNYVKSIVKITTLKGRIVGTGFVVTDDGIICTCYHNIGNPYEDIIYDDILVNFPNTNQTISAKILKDEYNDKYVDARNDIAFLQIHKTDQELIPLQLSQSVLRDHSFISHGFRKYDEFELGLGSKGDIIGLTKYQKDLETEIPIIQLSSKQVEQGMSGSPVLDIETNKIVGMIYANYPKKDQTDPDLVMAIPVESIIHLYEKLSEKNPGLVLINQFLEHIDSLGNTKYRNFDEVFVPPKEYLKIRKTLEEKRCVFITGTPEYGKTFTAVKLMWDKWKESKEKNYIINCKFPKEYEEKNKILKIIFEGNDEEQYSNSIIYIEDPTGKTESDYELNIIFRDFIISVIEHLSSINSYLIVTMREDIYQKTKLGIIGDEEKLEEFIQRLEIGSPSYDYELRKEILLRWANQFKCSWLDNDNLIKIVLDELKKEKLPTPLNIYEFTLSTRLNDTFNESIKRNNSRKV